MMEKETSFTLVSWLRKPKPCPLCSLCSLWSRFPRTQVISLRHCISSISLPSFDSWGIVGVLVCLDLLFSKSAQSHRRPSSDLRLRISSVTSMSFWASWRCSHRTLTFSYSVRFGSTMFWADRHCSKPSRSDRRIGDKHVRLESTILVDWQPATSRDLDIQLVSAISSSNNWRCFRRRLEFSLFFHCSARIDDILIDRQMGLINSNYPVVKTGNTPKE